MGELPRKQKRKPKMCNAQQQSPPQNTAWQGVYPDLSALNELFSTQQATAANAGQPSPWIGFLASLGLQPISGGQTPQQQQARPEQEPSAPPVPETERQEGHAYAGTNSATWGQPQHQPSPGASQQPRGRHQGLRHLLLHHRLPLPPLQPPRLPHPVRPLRGARHLLLRMPLPTVLAGHLLSSAISFLHPVCALFLLLPCLHKLHVRGQPLGAPASWGVRFTGSNAAWNQNVNHNHQC